MKRSIVTFLILMVIGALVIVASIELHANSSDTSGKSPQGSSVVLELFTSQGCSSCPPADELLKRVQNRTTSPVIAISYHVDYWNYIGWEDPFSKPEYTLRQSKYNQKFGSRSNYTPQLVINGKEHMVGSDASKLSSRISIYSSENQENDLTISNIQKETDQITIDYNIKGAVSGKSIRAVLLIDQRETYVQRGENRNRKLSNSNIAVSERTEILESPTGSLSLAIPDIVLQEDELRIVALIENRDLNITGAARSNSFLP